MTLLEGPSLDLHRGRHVALLGVEPTGQQGEFLDRLHLRQRLVRPIDLGLDETTDLGILGEVLEGREGNAVVLGELGDVVLVDQDERHQVLATIADHHRVLDVGAELELVLDVRGGDILAARGDDDVLLPVQDLEIAVLPRPDVAGVQPALPVDRRGRELGILEVAPEDVGPRVRISPSSASATSMPGMGWPTVPTRGASTRFTEMTPVDSVWP